jgi:hypothetical protein
MHAHQGARTHTRPRTASTHSTLPTWRQQ